MAGRYRLINQTSMHRRRSGWNSGGRKASAEGGVWGRVSIPSPADYRSIGQSRELPQRGPGQSPGRKRMLAYFEGHRKLLLCLYADALSNLVLEILKHDKIWGICISVLHSKFWGGDLSRLSPRDLRPCR